VDNNKQQSFDFIRINTPIWIETKQEEMFLIVFISTNNAQYMYIFYFSNIYIIITYKLYCKNHKKYILSITT
jgi:hypothetical protein